jgi:hypothetical protein
VIILPFAGSAHSPVPLTLAIHPWDPALIGSGLLSRDSRPFRVSVTPPGHQASCHSAPQPSLQFEQVRLVVYDTPARPRYQAYTLPAAGSHLLVVGNEVYQLSFHLRPDAATCRLIGKTDPPSIRSCLIQFDLRSLSKRGGTRLIRRRNGYLKLLG